MSAGVITRAGTPAQLEALLPEIAAGELIVTPAWMEPGHGFGPSGIQLAATPGGDGWTLSGAKRHVQFARAADRLLVLARTPEGPTCFLVDPAADGVELTQQMTISSDTQYRVDFTGVRVEASDVVGGLGDAWSTWHDAMHDGIILLAAQAVGGAQYAHAIANQYAKDRHQFDKPLGAFQSLAHYLSDAIAAIDGAETLVWEAGMGAQRGPPDRHAGADGEAVRVPDVP